MISEGHHSLFRVTSLNAAQQQEADEMEKYIDFAEVGIDKDKFVKGLFSYEPCGTKRMPIRVILNIS